jgi:hypothetical protein
MRGNPGKENMNPNELEAANAGAIRALVGFGLREDVAQRIARRMVSFQADEWRRIVERAKNHALVHVYVVVTHYDGSNFGTFLYAPENVNNIAVFAKYLSRDMGAGSQVSDSYQIGETYGEDEAEAALEEVYPVSVFDIANEINAAMRDSGYTGNSHA